MRIKIFLGFKIVVFLLLILAFCSSCIKRDISSAINNFSPIKFYGDRYGNFLSSFDACTDGGFVFGGYTMSSPSLQQQGFIQKCNSNGGVKWYKTYGGPAQDLFWVVHPTSDGSFIACGTTTSFGPGASSNLQSAYLVKTNGNGDLLWQKTYGGKKGSIFYDVVETPDHGFAAVGIDNEQFYVVKTNQNGDTMWTCPDLSQGYVLSYGSSVALGPNGEIAVAGYASFPQTSFGVVIYCYLTDSGKFILPAKVQVEDLKNSSGFGTLDLYNSSIINNSLSIPSTINLSKSPVCEKILGRPDGFIFIAERDNFSNTQVFKVDFNGSPLWRQIYTGKGATAIFSGVSNSASGGLLISGGTTSKNSSDPDFFWLLNLDSSGNKSIESFIPIQENAWAAGAVFSGNSIASGVNLTTPSDIHEEYFGLLFTDQNGNIKK